MITICNTSYLNSVESRKFLGIEPRYWQLHRFKVPFIQYEEEEYWKLADLEDVKKMLDKKKYIGEARLIIEVETHYARLRQLAEQLNLPRFKHPFNSRMLYRTSDIAVISRALNAKG